MENEMKEFFEEETADNTMEMAKRMIDKEENNEEARAAVPMMFRAEIQRNGKGSHGREWVSLKGNAHITIAIPREMISVSRLGLLPLEIGVILIKTLETIIDERRRRTTTTTRLSLKWPNDIITNEDNGRKLSGIIIETYKDWILIGIGVNVLFSPNILNEIRQSICISELCDTDSNTITKYVSTLIFTNIVRSLQNPTISETIIQEWTLKSDWNRPVIRRDKPGVLLKPLYLTKTGALCVEFPDGTKEDLIDSYLV